MKRRKILARLWLIPIAVLFLLSIHFIQGFPPGTLEEEAQYIIDESGVRGGLIVHLNCGDGLLTEALRINESHLVHGLDYDIENVQIARQTIMAKDRYGPVSVDLLVEDRLPYKNNLVNLIVSEDLGGISMDEVMRVLAPGGTAMIRNTLGYTKTVKPYPPEMDEWNHYLYNAGGNAVSNDEAIGPIKHYQWIGSPRWARHHDTTASMSAMVSAGGRIFYVLDEGPSESIQLPAENFLVARDAFNGVILWKRPISEWYNHLFPLKSGPAYLPRRLVAIGDRVYVTLGMNAPLSELDAATGNILRTFADTEQTTEIIYSEDTLFLVVGHPERSSEPYVPKHTYVWDAAAQGRSEWAWSRDPAQIMAINVSDGSLLWAEEYPVAPLSLSADANAVYFYDGSRIVSLDRINGGKNWESYYTGSRQIDTAYAPRLVVHDDVVLFSSGMRYGAPMKAFSTADGSKLWEEAQPHSGHYSPEDLFVIDGLVFTGATEWGTDDGHFVGRNIHTGEVEVDIPCDVDIYWFHQRCYPSKATKNYIIPSRTGIEFVDLEEESWTVNHYARGGCFYGVMPSNGLVYTPPHACACYMEAKLNGFCALGGAYASEPDLEAEAAGNRLEMGPSYGMEILDEADADDWPTYRHDAGRSAATSSHVAERLTRQWQMDLGGKLSSPVVAGNRVYVARVETHSVHALDAATGTLLWTYIAGGRVDSPPTIYKGRVLFGSTDGYVYCLNAANGSLIWRFRAAPMDQRMVAFEQLESVWPVHGSVLVDNDILYCVAGRSMFLDGGLRLLQLNPETGEKLSEAVLDEFHPDTGENLHAYVQSLDMPVGLPDILSSDGQYLYMRSQQFDLNGDRTQIGVRYIGNQLGEGAHVFSPVGFLDDSQFVRSYMMYGKSVMGGWGGWEVMGQLIPSGRLLAVGENNVYGFGRKPEFLSESMVLEYQLYSAAKSGNWQAIQNVLTQRREGDPNGPSFMNFAGDWKLRQGIPLADQSAVSYQWKLDKPDLQVRAMVLAGNSLFVAGPPDVVDEEEAFFALDDPDVLDLLAEQHAALEGEKGSLLWAVSAETGEKLEEYALDSLPVWDGLVAAGGNLYLTTLDGETICLSGVENRGRQRSRTPARPKIFRQNGQQ